MAEKVAILQKMVEVFRKTNATGFGKVLSDVKITGGGAGQCTCEMIVKEEHRNGQGFLHGGMTATLVESTSIAALTSLADDHKHIKWLPGTCMHLNISYLKAAAIGEEIVIDAKTEKLEKEAAILTVNVVSKQNGNIIAQASQTRWQGTEVEQSTIFNVNICSKLKAMAGTSSRTVAQIMRYLSEGKGFDRILNKVKVVSGSQGSCVCEMTVDQDHGDHCGVLHGGLVSTLVDIVSTCALMTTGQGVPGVSVNMSISHLNQARLGDVIVLDANTLRTGRNLAFLKVDITNKQTGQLIAKGEHIKFVGAKIKPKTS